MKKKEKDSSIKIKSENQGQRLDKFLTKELNITRSQIKKMILASRVLINEKPAKVHQFLKTDDKVKIIDSQPEVKTKTKKIKYSTGIFKKIKVVAKEPNFLILEKPAGLLVHPTDKQETNTLIDWLITNYPETKKLGEDPNRPALVHRLDKAVSGLMLIPRTQDAYDYFKTQFQKRKVIKKYTALVYGEIEKDEDEINFPIGRSKTKPGLFAAHPVSSPSLLRKELGDGWLFFKDKSAMTNFNVRQRFKNYTLLEIQILTGRTHQIRTHMLAYGHPVVGDDLYTLRNIKKLKTDQIFLHASYLSFKDLNGKDKEFKSKLPNTLKKIIKNLK